MTQYIDKAALVAEINRVLNSYDPNEITSGRYALISLRNFIDTLQAKEVDLEKEIDEFYNNSVRKNILANDNVTLFTQIEKVAKHFFELGLKVQKGE